MINPFTPWRHPGRLVRAFARVAVGLPVSVICFAVTLTLSVVSIATVPALLVGIPLGWVAMVVSRGVGRLYRSLVAAFDGIIIDDPIPPLTRSSWFGRLGERLGTKARWREWAHTLAALPAHIAAYVVVAGAWSGSIAMSFLPLYIDAMPGDTAKFGLFEIGDDSGQWMMFAIGVVGVVFIAPWVTVGASNVLSSLARSLLGPTKDQQLTAQMTRLETSRSAAVDAAETERRRIERDLHDGAQQRLVALAAGLGSAKDRLEQDPEGGREMVAAAHEEAKAALAEIRDLVRGIHPVILEDRGLDAALSAVVARSPVPVSLDVQVAERPPAAVESTAYFVVAEALTNVARHSNASRAHVSIARATDRLVVEVRDNGEGGADRAQGTGLQGLHDRVAGLGGSMYVISPEGGPTTIMVELPCAS